MNLFTHAIIALYVGNVFYHVYFGLWLGAGYWFGAILLTVCATWAMK